MIVYTLDEFAALSKEYKKSLFSISRNQFLSFITKYTLEKFVALSKGVEYKKKSLFSTPRNQFLSFITKYTLDEFLALGLFITKYTLDEFSALSTRVHIRAKPNFLSNNSLEFDV